MNSIKRYLFSIRRFGFVGHFRPSPITLLINWDLWLRYCHILVANGVAFREIARIRISNGLINWIALNMTSNILSRLEVCFKVYCSQSLETIVLCVLLYLLWAIVYATLQMISIWDVFDKSHQIINGFIYA